MMVVMAESASVIIKACEVFLDFIIIKKHDVVTLKSFRTVEKEKQISISLIMKYSLEKSITEDNEKM